MDVLTTSVERNTSFTTLNATITTELPVTESVAPSCTTSNLGDSENSGQDALFYIITVLMFYACSIIILLVKYVKRERQEATFTHYYYEYVTRERFQEPVYQNRQHLNKIMSAIKFGCSSKIKPTEDETRTPISQIYDYKLLQETQV